MLPAVRHLRASEPVAGAQDTAAHGCVVSLDAAMASRHTAAGQEPNLRKHQSRYTNRELTHSAAQRPLIRDSVSHQGEKEEGRRVSRRVGDSGKELAEVNITPRRRHATEPIESPSSEPLELIL